MMVSGVKIIRTLAPSLQIIRTFKYISLRHLMASDTRRSLLDLK
jgi:hypothetical protein